MSSTRAKLNRPKRRLDAVYRRGYEDGVAAAKTTAMDAEPVVWLRHGEEKPVQNVPFGAMWISDKSDPRAFPVFERPQQNVSVVSLIWEPHGNGWRGCGPIVYSVYPTEDGDGWLAALWMAGYSPFRELCKSPDAAKAASQKDFEVRIRDAVSAQVRDGAGWQDEDKLTPDEAWTVLCETSDITSPEEYPDHALITFEQLRSYMERAHPVPEGWQLAPQDATDEMVRAAVKVDWSNEEEAGAVHNIWHAMTAAAPAKQEGGKTSEEGLSNACRFESGSLTEAGWTVPTVAASKPAEDKRFAESGRAKTGWGL